MWPCRDTMRHISHFGYSPLEGLAPVSGGYHHALLYPRLASMPGLEIIHRSPLPTLLGWGPWNTIHTVVFVCWWCFCDPLGVVNCSFREKVNVSRRTKSPERAEIHSSAQALQESSNWRTVCLPAASGWMSRIWEAMLHNMFTQQLFWPAELDTHLTENLQCGFQL